MHPAAAQIEQYRDLFGETWEEFAERLGMHRVHLLKIIRSFNGETKETMRLATLENLASSLSEELKGVVLPLVFYDGKERIEYRETESTDGSTVHYVARVWRERRSPKSRVKAAEQLGLPKVVLAGYELGLRQPTVARLEDVSRKYGLDVHYLEPVSQEVLIRQQLVTARKALQRYNALPREEKNAQLARSVAAEARKIGKYCEKVQESVQPKNGR